MRRAGKILLGVVGGIILLLVAAVLYAGPLVVRTVRLAGPQIMGVPVNPEERGCAAVERTCGSLRAGD